MDNANKKPTAAANEVGSVNANSTSLVLPHLEAMDQGAAGPVSLANIKTMVGFLKENTGPPQRNVADEIDASLHAVGVAFIDAGGTDLFDDAYGVLVMLTDEWQYKPTAEIIAKEAAWIVKQSKQKRQPNDRLAVIGSATNAAAKLIDDGAPAAIAAYLATTALNLKLRWMTGAMQCWAIWSGYRWEPSQDRLPVSLQSAIRHHVADLLERHRIQPGAITQLENAAGMRGIGMQLAAWPSMKLDPSEVDPSGLLATPDGVIDLATREKLPHSPSRPITKVCPVGPGSRNGYWDKIETHLRQCLGLSYDACHRYLGSCLMGRGADRRLLWLCGPGGDGKSTLIRILRYTIGDYLAIVPAEVFGADGGRGAHLHELASGMAGARLAVALEVGRRLDWPKLKGLSGGDEQISKRLHGRSFAIKRPPCMVLVSNDKPDPPDNASAERIILAELQPPEEQDERLVQILADGGPERDAMAGACLSWLLRGCSDYNECGLGPVPSVVRMPGSFESWWQERLETRGILKGRGRTPLDAVSENYRAWCQTAEIEPVSQRQLVAFLKTVATSKHFPEGNRWLLTVAA